MLSVHLYFFTWLWKYYWHSNFLEKTTCLGKIWFLSYSPETSRPIRNYNISQTSWSMKLNFCLCVVSPKAKHLFRRLKWVWSGISGHAQCYAKSWVNFISRMSWAVNLVFYIWLGIHRSSKFVQSFQVGVFRHA